jgi:hypothetical protein
LGLLFPGSGVGIVSCEDRELEKGISCVNDNLFLLLLKLYY